MYRCYICKEEKLRTEFYSDATRKCGIGTKCKQCAKKYAKRKVSLFPTLKSKFCTSCKRKKSFSEFHRNRYAKDGLQWRCKSCRNPAKTGYTQNKKKYNVKGKHARIEWIAKIGIMGNKCTYCDSLGKLTKDHIISLGKGGTDNIDNIVPACTTCNCSKGSRSLEEFIYLNQIDAELIQRKLVTSNSIPIRSLKAIKLESKKLNIL